MGITGALQLTNNDLELSLVSHVVNSWRIRQFNRHSKTSQTYFRVEVKLLTDLSTDRKGKKRKKIVVIAAFIFF